MAAAASVTATMPRPREAVGLGWGRPAALRGRSPGLCLHFRQRFANGDREGELILAPVTGEQVLLEPDRLWLRKVAGRVSLYHKSRDESSHLSPFSFIGPREGRWIRSPDRPGEESGTRAFRDRRCWQPVRRTPLSGSPAPAVAAYGVRGPGSPRRAAISAGFEAFEVTQAQALPRGR